MWDVLEILAEKGKQYKVRWEGVDPKTKKPWPPSWVPKHDCTDALVREWKRNKAREKKEASKPNTRVKDTKKVTGKRESAKGKGKERARDEEPEARPRATRALSKKMQELQYFAGESLSPVFPRN